MPKHNQIQEIRESITLYGEGLLHLAISPTGLTGNTEAQRASGLSHTSFQSPGFLV